ERERPERHAGQCDENEATDDHAGRAERGGESAAGGGCAHARRVRRRGSMAAEIMSAAALTTTTIATTSSTSDLVVARSRVWTEETIRSPRPGSENTCSTMMVPAMRNDT